MQAALAAGGQLIQGIAGLQAGKYNDKVAKINQRDTLNTGAENAVRIRRAGRMLMGRQIGAQAESGFEVGTGTALDSLFESQVNIELEAMDMMRQSVARGVAFSNEGDLARHQGKLALIQGIVGAAAEVGKAVSDYAAAGA